MELSSQSATAASQRSRLVMQMDIAGGRSDTGSVLIHGKRAPICGRVCMDQFMVDVTDIPDVKIGDEVTLIGRDGDEVITMEEVEQPFRQI